MIHQTFLEVKCLKLKQNINQPRYYPTIVFDVNLKLCINNSWCWYREIKNIKQRVCHNIKTAKTNSYFNITASENSRSKKAATNKMCSEQSQINQSKTLNIAILIN